MAGPSSPTRIIDHTCDFENLRGAHIPSFDGTPLTKEMWDSFMEENGALNKPEPYIKSVIFRGGVEPALRNEVWRFVLGVDSWKSNAEERAANAVVQKAEYESVRQTWMSILHDAGSQMLVQQGASDGPVGDVFKLKGRKRNLEM
jgi:hypothetical protein